MNLELVIRLEGQAPRTWSGRGTEFTIGRDPGCDLVFQDDDTSQFVSSRHAQVRLTSQGAVLSDLGSSNGTFLADRHVSGDIVLRVGDQFTLGRNGPTILVRRIKLPAATSQPSDDSKSAAARSLWLVDGQRVVSQIARKMWDNRLLVALWFLAIGSVVWLMSRRVDSKSVAESSPARVLEIIDEDLRRNVAPGKESHQRYFTLTNLHNNSFSNRVSKQGKNVDAADLKQARAALSKLLNGLIWERRIVVPFAVDEDQTVLRIDLRDLGWEASAWTDLIRAYPYALRFDQQRDAASRPPLYHALLRLPEHITQLERTLGVDPIRDFQLSKLRRGAVINSGVSVSNRLLDRHLTSFGAYWKSYDFAKSDGNGNLLQNPLGPPFPGNPFREIFRHDGGEMIFNLPNGMQAYYLSDASGKRINEGPIAVVRDLKESSGSPVVVNGLSCLVCHDQGMKRFTDQVRKGHGVSGSSVAKIDELFATNDEMNALLDEDSQRFARAMEQATGPFLKSAADAS